MADPVLALPDHAKPFEVHTDALDYAIGGVLMQEGTQSPMRAVSSMTPSGKTQYKKRRWPP
jgi:hypothetical protein